MSTCNQQLALLMLQQSRQTGRIEQHRLVITVQDHRIEQPHNHETASQQQLHRYLIIVINNEAFDRTLESSHLDKLSLDFGAVHILYNAQEGGRELTICYMRYIREGGGGCLC